MTDADQQPPLSPEKQAWANAKPTTYQRPEVPEEARAGAAAAVDAARASAPAELAPEPRSPVFNPGFQQVENADLRGKFAAPGRRPDATLADALSPQMGLGFQTEVVQVNPP